MMLRTHSPYCTVPFENVQCPDLTLFVNLSTKDVATHFFIDYLPKGTYVFEYDLRVQLKGKYQSGVAEIQCMYAPEFTSHSKSIWLEVE